MLKIRLFFCFIYFVTFAKSASLTVKQKTRIESFINSLMSCRGIPGFTLAVVSGNDTWTKGFGLADIDKGVKVNKNTLFGIGSVTKAFTTTLVAMLLEGSNDKKRFRVLPEVRPFRDAFDYNNWPYGLLEYIIEVLAEEPFEETLRKKIFKPLGMSESRVLGKTVTTDDDKVAKPYMRVHNEVVMSESQIYNMHPFEAAGAIFSSAEDMSKWMHFLLRGRAQDGRTIVSSRSLAEMFSAHEGLSQPWMDRMSILVPSYPFTDLHNAYGYGWFQANYDGYKKLWHSGGLLAYVTSLVLYPELDIGIFTSVNGPENATIIAQNLISFYITDFLTGREPWLDDSTACTFPSPWLNLPALSQDNSDVTNTEVTCVQCYTGTYGHHFYGDAEVKESQSSGSLKLTFGRLYGTLNSTTDNSLFKWDVKGSFEFLSHPGNQTSLSLITFHDKDKHPRRYNKMELGAGPMKMVFQRNVSFYVLPKPTKPTNKGSELTFSNRMFVATLLIWSCYA